MKNLKKIGCFLVILLFVLIISIFIRNPMKNLPEGDFVQSLTSPNGEYTLNAYRYGGKMSFDAWSVRVEIVINKNQEKKNIYYKYKQYDIEMTWKNDNTVIINGTTINVLKEYYYKN
ncbi:MAG: DUF5412 domain-containing protein [Tenericutes bacterium]|nr:DUF5412 domain-containing protein [Mycoplasmatota bacterium]